MNKKLNEWLRANRWTKASAAGALGISAVYMSQITTGGVTPSIRVRKAVEMFTNGDIVAEGWGDDETAKRAAKE